MDVGGSMCNKTSCVHFDGPDSRTAIQNSHIKTTKCTNIKIIFFSTHFLKTHDTFRSISIIFRELLNIIKSYMQNVDY